MIFFSIQYFFFSPQSLKDDDEFRTNPSPFCRFAAFMAMIDKH